MRSTVLRAAAAALVLALAAAGCATMRADQRVQVHEVEESAVRTTPFARVAVVAIDRDPVQRRAWEDAFAARLGAAGTRVDKRDGLPGAAGVDADAIVVDGAPVIDAARAAGAEALMFVRPPNVVPMQGDGARRFLAARSGPSIRTNDLDDVPQSIVEVRVFELVRGATVWRGFVVVRYPPASGVSPETVATAAVGAMERRGLVRATPR